jgi:hypothetical protein
MHTCLTKIRYKVLFLLIAFLLAASMACGTTQAASGAPVVYSYNDPGTGTLVSYVGIPGGPVVYSNLGPGGMNSVTSVSTGGPVVYSNIGPDGITSVSYAGPGGSVIFSNLGPAGSKRCFSSGKP